MTGIFLCEIYFSVYVFDDDFSLFLMSTTDIDLTDFSYASVYGKVS